MTTEKKAELAQQAANRTQEFFNRHRLTAKQTAKIAGVDERTVRRQLETGMLSARVIAAISKQTGLPPAGIFLEK